MSIVQQLKDYFIKDDSSFLESDDNKGKVIMISGVWGSGKTFFWKNVIVNELKKPNIYISLYGKDSIDSVQQELFIKVCNLERESTVKNDIVSKTYSVFSFLGRSICAFGIDGKQFFEGIDSLNKNIKKNKAIESLSTNNIIICFDDFERKSTKIDLHDLFGFITQLALEFKCKIVIILNEDLFKNKDAEIFKRVKEKTVNKFIEFKPTIEELFTMIFNSDVKYKHVAKFKDVILSSIEEINELNARTYIQILDNCVEYYIHDTTIEDKHIRTLSIATAIFTNNNVLFYPSKTSQNVHETLKIDLFTNLPDYIRKILNQKITNPPEGVIENKDQFFEIIKKEYSNRNAAIGSAKDRTSTPDEILKPDILFLIENINLFWLIYFYCYKINFKKDLSNDEVIIINDFIKKGFI